MEALYWEITFSPEKYRDSETMLQNYLAKEEEKQADESEFREFGQNAWQIILNI